ncbi:MAG: hypothetical protein ACPKOI_09335 [Pleomorphochaeta sp.]
MLFSYISCEQLDIYSVKLIWYDTDTKPVEMQNQDDKWICNIDLSEGTYLYKILLNDILPINDSYSNLFLPDENDVLWSVLVVNENKERAYCNKQTNLNISDYILASDISNFGITNCKKIFIPPSDKMIATRLGFKNVTGVHTITALYISPEDEWFDIYEHTLLPQNKYVWFSLDLNVIGRNYLHGMWQIMIFVDGEFVLKDNFELKAPISFESKI